MAMNDETLCHGNHEIQDHELCLPLEAKQIPSENKEAGVWWPRTGQASLGRG